jgi:hypothetical protein
LRPNAFGNALGRSLVERKLAGMDGAKSTSSMVYNASGQMIAVNFSDPQSGPAPTMGPKSKLFILDAQGNILKSREVGSNSPVQEQQQVIANGQLQMRYSTSQGGFGGDVTGEQEDNFWRAYNHEANQNPLIDTPLTGGPKGNSGGVVIAMEGDTLQSLAERLYGDSSLWYKLAEANNLNLDAVLHGGQQLLAPVYLDGAPDVLAYNNGKIIGSTLPNLMPPPPPSSKWGWLPKLISIVVYVIVYVFSGNSVFAAMASNVAEQHSTNMVNGNYNWRRFVKRTTNPFSGNFDDFARFVADPWSNGDHKYFDFKAVARAGAVAYLMKQVGGTVGNSGAADAATSGAGDAAASGAASTASTTATSWTATAINEGMRFAGSAVLHVLSGQSFSWKAVAATYAAQHAGDFVGGAMEGYAGNAPGSILNSDWGQYAQVAIRSAASNVAYQVIRENRVDWKAVGLNTLSVVGNTLITNSVNSLGGHGSWRAVAARAAFGGAMAKLRHGDVLSGMVEGAGDEIIMGLHAKAAQAAGLDRRNSTTRLNATLADWMGAEATALEQGGIGRELGLAVGSAIGGSLAERLDLDYELESVRTRSTERVRLRADAMPVLQSLGAEQLPSAGLLDGIKLPDMLTDADVAAMRTVVADSVEVAGAGGGISALEAREARVRQHQQNAMYGISDDGVMNRLIAPVRGTGQRLVPMRGDGLSPASRYLRDGGFTDARAGTLEYDVGRRLIEDLSIVGAPEVALGLIPAKVSSAASRYVGAAGEFLFGEQRMARIALAGELRTGLQLGETTLGQGYGNMSALHLDGETNLLTFRASSMYSPSNADLSRLALDGFRRSGEPVFRTGEGLAASEFERAFGGMLDRITPDSWSTPNPPDFIIKGGQFDGKTVDFLYTADSKYAADQMNKNFLQNAKAERKALDNIIKHTDKADFVPMDLRVLNERNQQKLLEVIQKLKPAEQRKLVIIKG